MELIGAIDQKEYAIKIERSEDGSYQIEIDNRAYAIDCREVMPDFFSFLHQDRSYDVRIHRIKKGLVETHFYNHSFRVAIEDPMQRLLNDSIGGGTKGEATLEAPMPGKVQRILVSVGDTVAEGQGLLVLVAMKMENELASPKSGTVKEIHVQENTSVEGGSPLIVVA